MKLEPNLKKYKFNEEITEKKELENKFFDQEFIFDFIDDRNIRFRNLINYEVGGYTEKISIYDRQRNEILNNTKQDFIYQDYFNIASIFSFKEDDKVKILVSLFENRTLSQLEILFLLVKFKISYYIKYENFNDIYIIGLMKAVKAYEKLAAKAGISGDYSSALAALMVHPLIGDYYKAKNVLDDMLEANKRFLPQFFK